MDQAKVYSRTSRLRVRVKDVPGQGVELLDLEQAAPEAAVGQN